MDCADGLGLMTVYQVYPGIQLIYNDFEAAGCQWDSLISGDVLEINHCREGREGSTGPFAVLFFFRVLPKSLPVYDGGRRHFAEASVRDFSPPPVQTMVQRITTG